MTIEKFKRRPSLPAGIYILVQDVINPRADKRIKYDPWKFPIWRTGDKFVVEGSDELENDGVIIRHVGRNSRFLTFSTRNDDVFKVLLPALVPVHPEDYESIMLTARECPKMVSADDVLRHLVETGTVSLEELKTAIENC